MIEYIQRIKTDGQNVNLELITLYAIKIGIQASLTLFTSDFWYHLKFNLD